jgi:8-oxo-dGTP pyrophosphatase MutT (NUDIX family)
VLIYGEIGGKNKLMLFNETFYRTDKALLNFESAKMYTRKAVRAVINKDGKLLMIHLDKTDEYKFPGGGLNAGETDHEALIREVHEEAGYTVTKIGEKIGTITEYSIDTYDKNAIFKMTSDYYLVSVDDKSEEQHLEEYEQDLLFRPVWVRAEDAYTKNKAQIQSEAADVTRGIHREAIALEYIRVGG